MQSSDHLTLRCEALLVDFDGLLVDTEWAGWKSWEAVYTRYDARLDFEVWVDSVGSNAPFDQWDHLIALGHKIDKVQAEEERCAHRDTLMTARPGALTLLQSCADRGIPAVIVSNSPQFWIDRQLAACGLPQSMFHAILPGDGYPPKPAPDLYRRAVADQGLRPEQCVALEDSERGVLGAANADVACVAVPSRVTAHAPFSAATARVETLEDLRLDADAAGTPVLRVRTGRPSLSLTAPRRPRALLSEDRGCV